MSGATPRPFRFGVTHARVGDLPTWTAAARRSEELGYATLLLPDTVHTAAPFPALAAAAAVTNALHVGTWVVCEPLRTPESLAWQARSMQALCSDRFELGLGAGRPGAERDAAALGVPFGSPAERIKRLTSTVATLREQAPDLSILLAASGPRLLALAGRVADTVALGWPPDTDPSAAAARVEAVATAAQCRDELPELAAGLLAVGDIGVPYLRGLGVNPRQLADHDAVTVVHGTPQHMADQLLRRRDALGVSYITVPAETIDVFATVVEILADRRATRA